MASRTGGPPALSVVVVLDGRGDLQETTAALHRHGLGDAEIVAAHGWPPPPGAATLPDGVRRACAAGIGEAAACNAGIAAARGRRVLLLRAGDRVDPGVVEAHAAAPAGTVVEGIVIPDGDLDAVADGWAGVRPAHGEPRAARHLSADRATLVEAGGLDDRLRDLDVAALELLARLARGGAQLRPEPTLVIRDAERPFPDLRRRAVRAGRAAHALALLDLGRGAPEAPLAERLERLALAWAEPLLAALSAAGGHDFAALDRLALRAAFSRGRGLPPLPVGRGDRLGVPSDLPSQRPPVAVVMPFAGSPEEADEVLGVLTGLELGPDDDVVLVDNSRAPVAQPRGRVRVVRADGEWSSYHARNVGWRATSAPWILFVDADCRPAPWILDAYFAPEPADEAGAVAGDVLDGPGSSLASRYSGAVGVLRQSAFLAQEPRGFAATANLLVRRSALEELDGFEEGIRSSGDADLSHRLRDAGWEIEHRPRAAVVHQHRETLGDLVKQYRRYVSGVAWLRSRHDDVARDWPPHPADPLRGVPAHLVAARFGSAAVQALTAWTMWKARGSTAADNAAEAGPGTAAGAAPDPVGAPRD